MYGQYGPLLCTSFFFFFEHLPVLIKMDTELFRPLCEVLSH